MKQDTPSNHLDTPTPRCFPEWMRRLNPYLKKEDTNPFFEVYIRAKKLYGNCEPPILSIKALFILSPFIILLFVQQWSLVIMMFIFSFFLLFFNLFQLTVSKPNNIKTILRIGIFSTPVNRQFLSDLWLSNITGKDIIEGLFLVRGQVLKEIAVLFALLPVLFNILILVMIVFPEGILLNIYWYIISLISTLFVVIQIFLFVFRYYPNRDEQWAKRMKSLLKPPESPMKIVRNEIDHAINDFKQNSSRSLANIKWVISNPGDSFKRLCRSCLRFFLLSILMLLVIIIIMSFFFYLYTLSYPVEAQFYGFILLVYLVGGVYLHYKRKTIWIRAVRKTSSMVNELSSLYPDYFMRTISDGDDANPDSDQPIEKEPVKST